MRKKCEICGKQDREFGLTFINGVRTCHLCVDAHCDESELNFELMANFPRGTKVINIITGEERRS